MARPLTRRTAGHGVRLPAEAVALMRAELPAVADHVVTTITREVPSYADTFAGRMGENIRNAVQLALGGFLSLASGRRGVDPRTPTGPAVEGAYQLGRGEARSGRSTDALLSAYRIGARESWRQLSSLAVEGGMDAETVGQFAGLVFAYIDELSAASVAGHTDELATTGRVRQRLLERLAAQLLAGAPAERVLEAAAKAEWAPPSTLTAVLVAQPQVRPVLGRLPAATIALPEAPGREDDGLLLVPDLTGPARTRFLAGVDERDVTAGPARDWLAVRSSYDRALRARTAGLGPDADRFLAQLVLDADPEARADLRAQVLAPLADLRPATAEKLSETLRAWLLHHGRRDDVAAALFVHPQTVRYRMGQLRELFGDSLDDPETVLALTVALA
ncbi:helix-turn-helix domain-containing protein [Nocardioides sp. GY 10127]|uniref:PucR family transcriptional regulator n=1 Tax=Nocardioides sp. GY 10127 TaxID=2569762 RepID=UPI001F0EF828|nr:helix-turn-helix domain-containing protein [Nocardioides sp. GY 10127]